MLIQKVEDNRIRIKGSYYNNDVDKQSFGITNNEHVCRYCKRTEPVAKFTKKEHMISESIGNKGFVSDHCECDECNEYFSKLENDLNNVLRPLIVFDQIPGKTGPRSYKSFDKTSRMDTVDGMLVVSEKTDNKKTERDDKNQELKYRFDIPSYSPLCVFKVLTKMALSFLSPEDVADYSILAQSVRDTTKYFGFEKMLFCFNPFCRSELTVVGYKRKRDCKDSRYPTYQFLLMMENFSFQIPLYSDADIVENTDKPKMYSIPTPFDCSASGVFLKQITEIPITGTDVVERHEKVVTFHVDQAIKVDLNTAEGIWRKIRK